MDPRRKTHLILKERFERYPHVNSHNSSPEDMPPFLLAVFILSLPLCWLWSNFYVATQQLLEETNLGGL
jgi:hypothetical protein